MKTVNMLKQIPSNTTERTTEYETFSCSVAVVMHFGGLWSLLSYITILSLGTISWINNFTSWKEAVVMYITRD